MKMGLATVVRSRVGMRFSRAMGGEPPRCPRPGARLSIRARQARGKPARGRKCRMGAMFTGWCAADRPVAEIQITHAESHAVAAAQAFRRSERIRDDVQPQPRPGTRCPKRWSRQPPRQPPCLCRGSADPVAHRPPCRGKASLAVFASWRASGDGFRHRSHRIALCPASAARSAGAGPAGGAARCAAGRGGHDFGGGFCCC